MFVANETEVMMKMSSHGKLQFSKILPPPSTLEGFEGRATKAADRFLSSGRPKVWRRRPRSIFSAACWMKLVKVQQREEG